MRSLLVVAAAVVLAACSSGGGLVRDESATSTTAPPTSEAAADPTPTTSGEVFTGDPDSPFCAATRDAADRPVLDPFAPGLDAQEVELRFRALAQRFDGFADVAPEPLADDLALLTETFDGFEALLETADYDFARLAEADVDLSVFDDDRLGVVAARLASYQAQVCQQG